MTMPLAPSFAPAQGQLQFPDSAMQPFPVNAQLLQQSGIPQNVSLALQAVPNANPWLVNPMVANLAMQAFMSAQQPQIEVGKAPGDEDILVAALHAGISTGHTSLYTLNKMQGVNGHSAEDWKGYYMSNAQRIDNAVAALKTACHESVIKKDVDDDEIEIVYSAPSMNCRSQSRLPVPDQARDDSVQILPKEEVKAYQSLGSSKCQPLVRTRYRGSHAAPASSHRAYQGAPKWVPPAYLRRPTKPLSMFPTPSCPPIPPTRIVKTALGNIYTPEDRDFFVNLILWEASCDPYVTKTSLLAKLRKLVPHHSGYSWDSFWGRNAGSEVLTEALRRRRMTRTAGQASLATGAAEDIDDLSNLPPSRPTSHDDMMMGRRQGNFTIGDLHAMARAAATLEWQSSASDQGKGAILHEMYPQRSVSGWANGFRRNAARVMELSKLYVQSDTVQRPAYVESSLI